MKKDWLDVLPTQFNVRKSEKVFPLRATSGKKVFNRRARRILRALLKAGFISAVITFVPLPAEAALGIESGAMRIYSSIVSLGKWVIIIKGTIDCIQSVLGGDFASAKRQFFGYIMCFAIMLGLPWAMNEVEAMFK